MEDKKRLVLSMTVKNEEKRYLESVLLHHIPYVDYVVIIDDASTDGTVAMCERLLENVPHKLIKNKTSLFTNEVELRKQLWEETINVNPEWILILDADEMFDNHFGNEINNILSNSQFDAVYFRLYDMWSETHYREDQYWSAHHYFRPFLVRFNPNITYDWKNTPQHCGRFPTTISHFPYLCHHLKIKHFGWSNEYDRKKKYDRYLLLDPNGIYGWKEQYESILDINPNLIKWEDT